jgi:cytochrome P450
LSDTTPQEVEERVKKEATAVFGAQGSTIPGRELIDSTMDWTLATLKEVLRLYSVVPVVTRVTVVRTGSGFVGCLCRN